MVTPAAAALGLAATAIVDDSLVLDDEPEESLLQDAKMIDPRINPIDNLSKCF